MTVELRLPELAESMTSATVTAWLKQPGERVVQGDPVVEVDTDKTTVEIEASVDGVLREVLVPEGTEEVEVGTVLALIDDDDDDNDEARDTQTADAAPAQDGAAPAVTERPASGFGERLTGPDSLESPRPASDSDAGAVGINATPLARRMAAVAGVDLTTVDGTGTDGRVRKVDVDRLIGADGEDHEGSTPSESVAHTDHPLSTVRRVTAERLTRAKQTVPHFYLSSECDMSAVIDQRARHNATSAEHLTLTDIVVRASALALGRVPSANSAWHEEGVRVFAHADIAVAVNTSTGLFTPIVRNADQKTLGAIARELRDLTDRARRGQLRPDEYSGGSFTVSNLGMFDVASLYAIVNPPQSCILGVGTVRRTPVVRDDAIVIGEVATLTLSADHRALDGAIGGELLRELKSTLEDPAQLFDL